LAFDEASASQFVEKQYPFPEKTLYKARARIEQAVGKLKRFKRIALRCEKTAQNYGSFVALALLTSGSFWTFLRCFMGCRPN
jgi:transposase